MKKISVQWIAESAIIAALYAALTWLLAPISYGSIQFRISEILVLFVVFKPSYAFALIVGCFIANTTSSLGAWDMVFGTLATACAVIPMMKIKKLWVAAILPVVSNAIIVALELYYALDIAPIWLSMITVGLGEAVVLFLIGIPVMMSISKNEALVDLLHLDVSRVKQTSFFTLSNTLAIAAVVLGAVLYIAYPLFGINEVIDGESITTYSSAFSLTKDSVWMILYPIIVLIFGGVFFLTKGKVRLICSIGAACLLILPLVLTGVNYTESLTCPYYYGYVVYIALLVGVSLLGYKESKDII